MRPDYSKLIIILFSFPNIFLFVFHMDFIGCYISGGKGRKGSDIIYFGFFFISQKPASLTGCVDCLYPLYNALKPDLNYFDIA